MRLINHSVDNGERMKRIRVAIPVCDKKKLEDEVFEHFGHTPYFLIIDVDGNRIVDVEEVPNPYAEQHLPGEIPKLLHSHNVDILICRGIGMRAKMLFKELGISVITGASGKIRDIINDFLSGRLSSIEYTPSRKWNET